MCIRDSVDGTWEAMWEYHGAATAIDAKRVVPDSLILTVRTTAARERVKTVRTKTGGYQIVAHRPDGGVVMVEDVEVRQEAVLFFSTITFRIFREGDATTVHAIAYPVNNGVVSRRGNSTGYTWWQEVLGHYEAALVRDALRFVVTECGMPAPGSSD